QRSPVLDRPVGDAPVGVQPVGLGERAGRAGVQAEGAAPAEIFKWPVRRQVEAEEELAEEEPRSTLGMEQHRILPHRADPRPSRQLALEDRPGVDVAPGLAARERREDALLNGPETLADDLVIILPAGVAGHPAPEVSRRLRLPLAVLPIKRMVRGAHAEAAAGAGEDRGGIEPRLDPPAEVLHPR